MSKEPTTIPDDAAALVLSPDGRIEMLFPNGALDEDDDAPVPHHCLVIGALGSLCLAKPEVVDAIIAEFKEGGFLKGQEDVSETE